jgi:hypothetical protein
MTTPTCPSCDHTLPAAWYGELKDRRRDAIRSLYASAKKRGISIRVSHDVDLVCDACQHHWKDQRFRAD